MAKGRNSQGQEELRGIGTPYDDVFKTMLVDCRQLVLPLLNELFGESYRGDEVIEFYGEEHRKNQEGGETEKRIVDSSFSVYPAPRRLENVDPWATASWKKHYHMECESGPDQEILLRLFEYDAQLGLDQNRQLSSYELTVHFPHTAVLFLDGGQKLPERMKTTIVTPGGSVTYEIPVMKMQDYTLETLFEKKLYFRSPSISFSIRRT